MQQRDEKRQKELILEGTVKAFNEKGLKFTMDDVAKLLGISKKTIYTVFGGSFVAYDKRENPGDSRRDAGELPGCGFQAALSAERKISRDLQTGGKAA